MQKRVILILSVLIVTVLILGLLNDARAFIRKNLVKFYTANYSYNEIYFDTDYKLLFCAKNLLSPGLGDIQFVRDNFDYVEKGEIIGLLSTKNGLVDIVAPVTGYFLKGFVSLEFNSLPEALSKVDEFKFDWFSKKDVKENSPIACIITSDVVLALPKEISISKSLTIYISDFVKSKVNLFSSNEYHNFYKVSDFIPEIFLTKKVKILKEIVYGLKFPKSALISRNGANYIYIVNGNVIKNLKVNVVENEDGFVVASVEDPEFTEFRALIVVLTPKLFKVGEVVGNF